MCLFHWKKFDHATTFGSFRVSDLSGHTAHSIFGHGLHNVVVSKSLSTTVENKGVLCTRCSQLGGTQPTPPPPPLKFSFIEFKGFPRQDLRSPDRGGPRSAMGLCEHDKMMYNKIDYGTLRWIVDFILS